MDNFADPPGADNIPYRKGVGLAAVLRAHLDNLAGLL
jgi:hypothetical protein